MFDSSSRPSFALAAGCAALVLALPACRSNDAADDGMDEPALETAPASGDTANAATASIDTVRVDGEPSGPATISVPGTDVTIDLVTVPGGELFGTRVEPFAIATLEVTWNQYMAMVAEADGPPPSKDGTKIDGLARPTKPYIATDRGFGQEDRPIISISALGAESFCDWLSLRTGKRFRLPTETEWEWAARAGSDGPYTAGVDADGLDAVAWYADNSESMTQPVGGKAPNAWGLFDVHGNIAEWTRADEPGEGRWESHVLCGGSFYDSPDLLVVTERERRDSSWNMSDPQIPQSVWWLADAAWPGMRVVMELD